MVKLENYMTGKKYNLIDPDIAYVGPFTIRGVDIDGEIHGKWKMKLRDGEKFTAVGGISAYVQLAKILLRRVLNKEAQSELNEGV